MYKVVKNIEGKLYSCWVYNTEASVEYIPHKWVYPKINNPLMAFNSLERAVEFAINHNNVEIWSCIAVEDHSKKLFCHSAMNTLSVFLKDPTEEKLFLLKNRYTGAYYDFDPPYGTIFCSSIKILKKKIAIYE